MIYTLILWLKDIEKKSDFNIIVQTGYRSDHVLKTGSSLSLNPDFEFGFENSEPSKKHLNLHPCQQ